MPIFLNESTIIDENRVLDETKTFDDNDDLELLLEYLFDTVGTNKSIAHYGSRLAIKSCLPVDFKNTVFLAHYDITEGRI